MSNIKWSIDPTHSEVSFKVKHLMITNVTGSFVDFTGSIETQGHSLKDANVQFLAKIASINTNNKQRDSHLLSPEFFDADKFPELSFVSTSFEPAGGQD